MTSSVNKISGTRKAGLLSFAGIVFYCAHILQQAQARDEAAIIENSDMALDTSNDNVVAEQVSPESIDQLNANPISEASVMSADLSTVNVNEEDKDGQASQAESTVAQAESTVADASGGNMSGALVVGGVVATAITGAVLVSDNGDDKTVSTSGKVTDTIKADTAADQAAADLSAAKAEADRLKAEADRLKAEADKLKAEAEAKAKAEVDKAKAEAEAKAKAEVDKAKAEAEAKAKAEAEAKAKAEEEAAAKLAAIKQLDAFYQDNGTVFQGDDYYDDFSVGGRDYMMTARSDSNNNLQEIFLSHAERDYSHSAGDAIARGNTPESFIKAAAGSEINELSITDNALAKLKEYFGGNSEINVFASYKIANTVNDNFQHTNFEGLESSVIITAIGQDGDIHIHPVEVGAVASLVDKFQLLSYDGSVFNLSATSSGIGTITDGFATKVSTLDDRTVSLHLPMQVNEDLSMSLSVEDLPLSSGSTLADVGQGLASLQGLTTDRTDASIKVIGKVISHNLEELKYGSSDDETLTREVRDLQEFTVSSLQPARSTKVKEALDAASSVDTEVDLSATLTDKKDAYHSNVTGNGVDAEDISFWMIRSDDLPATLSGDMDIRGEYQLASDRYVDWSSVYSIDGVGFFVNIHNAEATIADPTATPAVTAAYKVKTDYKQVFVPWSEINHSTFSTSEKIDELQSLSKKQKLLDYEYVGDDIHLLSRNVDNNMVMRHLWDADAGTLTLDQDFSRPVLAFYKSELSNDLGGSIYGDIEYGADHNMIQALFKVADTTDASGRVTKEGSMIMRELSAPQIEANDTLIGKLTPIGISDKGSIIEGSMSMDNGNGLFLAFADKAVSVGWRENDGKVEVIKKIISHKDSVDQSHMMGEYIMSIAGNGKISIGMFTDGESVSRDVEMSGKIRDVIAKASSIDLIHFDRDENSAHVFLRYLNNDGESRGDIIKVDMKKGMVSNVQQDINLTKLMDMKTYREGDEITVATLEDTANATTGTGNTAKLSSFKPGVDMWSYVENAPNKVDVGTGDKLLGLVDNKEVLVMAKDGVSGGGTISSAKLGSDGVMSFTEVKGLGVVDASSNINKAEILKAVRDIDGDGKVDHIFHNSDGSYQLAFGQTADAVSGNVVSNIELATGGTGVDWLQAFPMMQDGLKIADVSLVGAGEAAGLFIQDSGMSSSNPMLSIKTWSAAQSPVDTSISLVDVLSAISNSPILNYITTDNVPFLSDDIDSLKTKLTNAVADSALNPQSLGDLPLVLNALSSYGGSSNIGTFVDNFDINLDDDAGFGIY